MGLSGIVLDRHQVQSMGPARKCVDPSARQPLMLRWHAERNRGSIGAPMIR
jgi:hypothetical protein